MGRVRFCGQRTTQLRVGARYRQGYFRGQRGHKICGQGQVFVGKDRTKFVGRNRFLWIKAAPNLWAGAGFCGQRQKQIRGRARVFLGAWGRTLKIRNLSPP